MLEEEKAQIQAERELNAQMMQELMKLKSQLDSDKSNENVPAETNETKNSEEEGFKIIL